MRFLVKQGMTKLYLVTLILDIFVITKLLQKTIFPN